jgi:uncharacterized membrane protein YkvA (DUF1232 family)
VAVAGIPFLPWGLAIAAAAIYLLGVLALVAGGRHTEARALAGFVPDCAILMKRLATDPATSRRQRLMLLALALYLASPIDLIPDFIPVAGQLDDAIIVALALGAILRASGEEPIRAAWPGPEASLRVVLRAARRS